MSFLSDFFEGNFGNLGTDIVDAPSSLANHPSEILDVGLGAAAVAAPFLVPEIGAGLGIGGSIDAAAGGGLAADLGIGDIGAAASADTIGTTAADFGFLGGGGADVLAAGGDTALGFGSNTALSADSSLGSFLADPSLGADTTSAASFTDPTAAAAGSGDIAPGAAPSPAAPSGVAATPTGAAPNSAFSALTQGSGIGGDVTNAPEIAQYADNSSFGVPSFTDKLGGVLSSPWTKLAVGAAPLALALGIGQQQLPASAQQLQGQASALQQQGLTNLSQAQAGVLNAGQTAVLGQMRTDLTNSWRQALANQGVQDPTKDARWPQIEAAIDAQVTQQTATLIQQNITNALAETGQASTALTAIANMQFQADQNFTNSLINATKSLGVMAAISGGAKVNQTVTV